MLRYSGQAGVLHDHGVIEGPHPVLELVHHGLGEQREVLEVLGRVLLGVVVPELCLEAVAGQDDGLLVVASQPPLHNVHFELEEVVVPRDLILQQGHVSHVEDDTKEEVGLCGIFV